MKILYLCLILNFPLISLFCQVDIFNQDDKNIRSYYFYSGYQFQDNSYIKKNLESLNFNNKMISDNYVVVGISIRPKTFLNQYVLRNIMFDFNFCYPQKFSLNDSITINIHKNSLTFNYGFLVLKNREDIWGFINIGYVTGKKAIKFIKQDKQKDKNNLSGISIIPELHKNVNKKISIGFQLPIQLDLSSKEWDNSNNIVNFRRLNNSSISLNLILGFL